MLLSISFSKILTAVNELCYTKFTIGVDILMNFDKESFSQILIQIKDSYGSINKMAEKSDVTAAYISKLIRLMYSNAPSPVILEKIAKNSNGITTYEDLMRVCGHIKSDATADDLKQYYMCPVYSQINTRLSNWTKKCIEGRIPIDPELLNISHPEEYYFLHVAR